MITYTWPLFFFLKTMRGKQFYLVFNRWAEWKIQNGTKINLKIYLLFYFLKKIPDFQDFWSYKFVFKKKKWGDFSQIWWFSNFSFKTFSDINKKKSAHEKSI